jgi:hypothetical protein
MDTWCENKAVINALNVVDICVSAATDSSAQNSGRVFASIRETAWSPKKIRVRAMQEKGQMCLLHFYVATLGLRCVSKLRVLGIRLNRLDTIEAMTSGNLICL